MKILVASDGSEHSKAGLRLLKRFPLPTGAEVILLSVLEPIPGLTTFQERDHQAYTEFRKWRREQAGPLLAQDLVELQETGWKIQTIQGEGHVADEITRVARAEKTDLVVVGSRGLGRVESYLLGSVTYQVIKHSPCSVLVTRLASQTPPGECGAPAQESAPRKPLKILLALDSSPNSGAALKSLASLPLRNRAEVTALTVLTVVRLYRMDILQRMGEFWKEEKRTAEATLSEAQQLLQQSKVKVKTQLSEGEDAVQEIIEAARRLGCDLIVLGDKGESGITGFLLGSVSNGVVQHADCSVLIVKGDGFVAASTTAQSRTPDSHI